MGRGRSAARVHCPKRTLRRPALRFPIPDARRSAFLFRTRGACPGGLLCRGLPACGSLGTRCLPRGCRAVRGGPPGGRRRGLPREGTAGGRRMPLVLEGLAGRPRATRGRRPARAPSATSRVVGLGLSTCLLGGGAPLRRRQRDARAPRLRQTDRDRLLRRPRPVLSGADVVNLFSHVLSRLSRRGLPLGLVALRSSSHSLFGHRASPCFAARRGPQGLAGARFAPAGGRRETREIGSASDDGAVRLRSARVGTNLLTALSLTFPHVRYATCRCVIADGTCAR